MKVLGQALTVVASLGLGLLAGMWLENRRATAALEELAVYDFATGMRSQLPVVAALHEGRHDDAIAQLEYSMSTSLAFLCAEARRSGESFDLYVSQAMSEAATRLSRKDCVARGVRTL